MSVGDDKIAEFSVNNYAALKLKHPQRENCSVPEVDKHQQGWSQFFIKQTLGSNELPSMLEPLGLYRTDGKRPDEVTMIAWEMGEQLVWDVTVVDALALSRLEKKT